MQNFVVKNTIQWPMMICCISWQVKTLSSFLPKSHIDGRLLISQCLSHWPILIWRASRTAILSKLLASLRHQRAQGVLDSDMKHWQLTPTESFHFKITMKSISGVCSGAAESEYIWIIVVLGFFLLSFVFTAFLPFSFELTWVLLGIKLLGYC